MYEYSAQPAHPHTPMHKAVINVCTIFAVHYLFKLINTGLHSGPCLRPQTTAPCADGGKQAPSNPNACTTHEHFLNHIYCGRILPVCVYKPSIYTADRNFSPHNSIPSPFLCLFCFLFPVFAAWLSILYLFTHIIVNRCRWFNAGNYYYHYSSQCQHSLNGRLRCPWAAGDSPSTPDTGYSPFHAPAAPPTTLAAFRWVSSAPGAVRFAEIITP